MVPRIIRKFTIIFSAIAIYTLYNSLSNICERSSNNIFLKDNTYNVKYVFYKY